MSGASSTGSAFSVGFGKATLDAYERGTGMFGWCQPENVALEVAAPLEARAMVVEDAAGRRFALVVCDLGFVSTALRAAVERRCAARGLLDGPGALMLAATHTHSGPSGYAEHLLYALAAPGFFPLLVEALADGVTEAIARAHAARAPALLRVAVEPVPLDVPIAFNRRLTAYVRNREVVAAPASAAHAVDRRMTVLWADHADTGRPLGLVSWLGVHGTTLHADNQALHPDHKGLAASLLEQDRGGGFVALFAQGAAGDVTPNHRASPRGFEVGAHDDDLRSAYVVARAQAEHAAAIVAAHARATPLLSSLGTAWAWRDFHAAPLDPCDADGVPGRTTEPPRLGLAFAAGTREGPGPLSRLPDVGPRLARLAARFGLRAPGLVASGRGGEVALLGRFAADGALVRLAPGRQAAFLRAHAHAATERGWVPHVLPGQLVRLGRFTLVGLPMEPTTIAARRVERVLARAADEPVVVAGYANDYASYLTTPEEYALQDYEGASTLFGPNTLGAWCTLVRALDAELRRDAPRATC